MFERGIWYHLTPVMYEPLLHIPLLIWGPGIETRQDIHQPTSTIDLLPTMMEITGHKIPAWCEGHPLPGFGSTTADNSRSVFAIEAKENSAFFDLEKASFSLRKGPLKLTYYSGYERIDDFYELYDLDADPEELNNLYPSQPAEAAAMREELLTTIEEKNAAW
jgi:arylsulfatase A-like enzyme